MIPCFACAFWRKERQRTGCHGDMIYTDEEILKNIQRDRETGAAMLMEEYAGLIWSVCERYLDNVEDIRECVNSAFADFCLECEQFDAKKASLKTYLCAIARNKAIDCYQANGRRARLQEKAEAMLRADSAADSMTEQLEEALEQLEPLDGQILRMKYYGGHSYQEIADELGLKEAAVKMRSMRSRRKLLKILIGTLILLLLAACAATVIRHYRFSERAGIVWSEEERLYELDSGDYRWEMDGCTFEITDAVLVTSDTAGDLTIYLSSTPLEKVHSLEEYAMLVDVEAQQAWLFDAFGASAGSWKLQWDSEHDTLLWQIDLKCEVEKTASDSVILPLYLEQDEVLDVVLTSAELREYDAAQTEIAYLDGLTWTLGPAIAGEEFTVVNMSQSGDGTWSVSPQFTSSRYGLPEGLWQPIVLIDAQGEEYELRYGSVDDQNTAQAQYNLYFPSVPAGDYTLRIPYIFLKSSGASDTFALTLPEAEGEVLACDVTATFPDGSAIHITGITKSEYIQLAYDLDTESGELVENSAYYWQYALDIQTISTGSPVLHMAVPECVDGTAILSDISESGVLAFRVLQGDEPKTITLRFIDPEYLLDGEFTLKLSIQSAEE